MPIRLVRLDEPGAPGHGRCDASPVATVCLVPPESAVACVAVAPPVAAVTTRVMYEVYCACPLGMYAARKLSVMGPGVVTPLWSRAARWGPSTYNRR